MNVEEKTVNQTIGSSFLDLFACEELNTVPVDTNNSIGSSLGLSQIHDLDMEIERFSYDSALGEGAYGKVWKASDTDIGRSVAVKSYKIKGPTGVQLLSLETNIAGKIDHPGIPTLYDIRKTEDGQCHYIMRLIEGESLEEIITRLQEGDEETHEKYRFEQRVDIVIQILRVLSAAHNKNIIHRDLKPENIMIGTSGEVYVMDWGVALDLEKVDGEGQLAGTPRYMSPEQASKKKLTPASDIYAVTAIFYELMSLNNHGPKYTDMEDLLQKLPSYKPTHFELTKGHPTFGSFPMTYASIMDKGFNIDPNMRYRSAEEMLADIEAVLSGEVSVGCPITFSFKVLSILEKAFSVHPVRTFFGLIALSLGSIASLIYIGTLL